MPSTPIAEGPSCPLQHTADSERDALPAAFVLLELSAAGCRQRSTWRSGCSRWDATPLSACRPVPGGRATGTANRD